MVEEFSDVNVDQSHLAAKPTQFISNARKHMVTTASSVMTEFERESSLTCTAR